MKKSKVVIVGAGNVGSTTAFCMINQSICDEVVLIDINRERAEGEILDMMHSMEFMGRRINVKAGDYSECRDADVVIITASAPMQKDLNDRMDLMEKSKGIMKSIVESVMEQKFDGILLVVSNPVDIMTHYAQKISGLAPEKVIGSGTTLDTARLKYYISEKIDVDPRSVDAYVIGEHGDSEMIAWSTATVGGKDIHNIVKDNQDRMAESDYEELLKTTIQAGWEIFSRKGSTTYGIAASVTSIVKSILFDEKRIYPISVYLNGEYGVENVYISVPTIISSNGAKEIVELRLAEEEQDKFLASCKKLKETAEEFFA